MARFILTIQASVNTAAGAAPVLDIFVNGSFVTSSAAITAVTGVGSDILMFTLDFDDSINDYPSALSFQFSGSSGDGNETITIEAVRINGRALNTGGDLTATILTQAQTASVNALAAKDYLFGRADPALGDFGSTTQTGSGTFSGTNGEDIIDGSAGADRIRGLTNDDAISGGAGNDTIYGEEGNDAILGGAGNDKLFGGNGDDMLHGQDDNDTLFGDAGNDLLNGGAGNDVLNAGSGNDVLYGEAGDDRLLGVSGDNFMYGDDGNDMVLGGSGNDTMYGGANNDTLHGANGNDTIYGDAGDDFATGGNGTDTMYGGGGDDRFYGGAGADTIYGGTANDALYGDEANDTLHGDDGDDMLTGGDGADTLNGNNDNDILYGSGLTAYEIAQILQANPNVVYSEITNSFYQLINTTVNFVSAQSAGGAALINGVAGHLVTINSAAENAVVDGIAAGNQVWINAADSGSEGQWRWAGGQEDGLLLWNGDQTGSAMNGFYTNWAAGQPSGGALNDAATMLANGTWDDVSALSTYRYIIEWDGASLSDDNAADILSGGAGNDLLFGHGGGDTLNGNSGIDHIFGGEGNDTMNGGSENDFLIDDVGANNFYGDDGNDTLDARFQTAVPSVADQITAILASNPGLTYSAASGNFYQLIIANVDWDTAVANSAAALLNGIAGHLVTITTTGENDFISTMRIGNEIWLGASDRDVEGEWRWMVGPEAGQQFWSGAAAGTSVGGMFENWDSGEPNDYTGGEDYATMWQAGNLWNDNGPPRVAFYGADYVIEWEGSQVLITPPAEPVQQTQYMEGGAGNDTIYAGNIGDTIYGDDAAGLLTGDDTIYAGSGADTVDGGQGNDVIYGQLGSDAIYGNIGNDILYANVDPGLTAIPLNAVFNANAESFTYADGFPVVGGSDPANIDVTGSWINTDGYAPGSGNGALMINFDSTGNPTGPISGHYNITVTLTAAMTAAQLSFAYRMFLNTNADTGENLYVYADVNGTQYGVGGNAWVDSVIGNLNEGDSGWLTVTLNLGPLAAGSHTIRIGGYVNDVSDNAEDAWVRLDDIKLQNEGTPSEDVAATNLLDGGAGTDTLYGSTGTDTLLGGANNDTLRSGSATAYATVTELNATFNASADGFAYADGFPVVGGSDPGNIDITGSWDNTDGYAPGSGNGSILVNFNSTGNPNGPLSGHHSIIVNLSDTLVNTTLTFAYRMFLNTAADAGEDLYVYADINGTQYGVGGNAWVDSRLGNTTEGDSGWRTVTLNIGSLGAGNHTVRLGGYINDVSDNAEDAWVRFDDVVLAGGVVSDTIHNRLNGGSGVDQLYGSAGADIFEFDSNGGDAFTSVDTIHDFDRTDLDKIDISDILSGLGVNGGNLANFVDVALATGVRIDVTGSGNFGGGGKTIATFSGTTNVTDEAALFAAGQLII